jgi:hypothetical protein
MIEVMVAILLIPDYEVFICCWVINDKRIEFVYVRTAATSYAEVASEKVVCA